MFQYNSFNHIIQFPSVARMFQNINNFLVLILACSTFVTHHNVHGYVSEIELVSHHNARRFYFGTYNGAILETSVPYTFLGNQYKRFFINGHGMITLGEEKDCCPHKCSPSSVETPTIGAYMRANQQSDDAFNAKVLYQEFTFVETPSEFNNIVADITWSFPGYTERLTRMIVVTWRDIPTYGANLLKHRRNTFQTVLATDDVNGTFVLFYYNRIEWPSFETGRDPVEAGIYGGRSNPSEFYMLPGSCNYSLINIAGMSNIDKPGKFVFKVGSVIEHPNISRKCAPVGNMSVLRISHRRRIWQDVVEARPRVVPSAGVVPVVLSGIPICSDFNVTRIVCTFWDTFFRYELTTEGVEVPGNIAIICHTPKAFKYLGRNNLVITIEFAGAGTIDFESYVLVTDISRSVEKNFGRLYIPSPEGGLYPMEVNRTFGEMLRKSCPSPVMVNASVEVYSETGWEEIYTKAISGDRPENVIELPESIQTSHFSGSTYNRARVKLSSQILLNNFKVLNSEIVYDVEPEYEFYYGENIQKCHTPHEIVTYYRGGDVFCPFSVKQAKTDDFLEDITESKMSPIISFVPLAPGSPGFVCIYNRTSGWLQSAIGVNMTRSGLTTNMKYFIWTTYLSYYIRYIYCCKLNSSCPPTFYPAGVRNSVYVTGPFQVTGATHITVTNSFGTSFTILEEGVFLLFRVHFTSVQIFSESLISHTDNSAAVVRMVVIQHYDHVFQVNVASEGLQVWIDNGPVNFYNRSSPLEYINDNFIVYGDGTFTVKIIGHTAAVFTFENGISMQFTVCEAEESLNILGFDREEHFFDASSGILAVKPGVLLNTTAAQNEWRVAKKDILQHQSQFFTNFGQISPETPLKVNVLDQILDTAANMTFCQGYVRCNVEYMLTKNENLAKCTMKLFADRDSLQRRELHPIVSSTTEDLHTTTIQNKAAASTMNTKQYVGTDSSSSEDYDSNEIVLLVATTTNEQTTTTHTKSYDITTNNGQIQESTTTKSYNLESGYGFEGKLALWLMGVILVLGVLILAANICLYIGVRRNSRAASDVALNWFVQYRK